MFWQLRLLRRGVGTVIMQPDDQQQQRMIEVMLHAHRQQLDVLNRCARLCIPTVPPVAFSGSDKLCLENCTTKYLETALFFARRLQGAEGFSNNTSSESGDIPLESGVNSQLF